MKKFKEYLIRVWFKPIGRIFIYLGNVYTINNKFHKGVYIDIAAKSVKQYGSKRWEEDMINHVLDGFEGTDMKIIDKIEY